MAVKGQFDGVVFDQLRRIGGEKLISRLVDLFLETVPLRLESAESGVQAGDLEAVARTMHGLRSSFQIVGAAELAALAGRIEEKARRGDPSPVGILLRDLRAGVQVVLQDLREGRSP